MLFWRSLKKNAYFLVIALFLLAFSCTVWQPHHLIVALPEHGFIDSTEFFIPFVLLLPISFLLYDNFEIELGLTCGVKTTKLLYTKFIAILLFAITAAFAMVALFEYEPYVPQQSKIIIPIHIPENYKVYMFISAFVTTVFFASLFLFMRVAIKNCYAPVGLGVLVYTVFNGFNYDIHSGYTDIRKCLFDPFLSNYFMGDTVLTEYYRVGPLWTYNRLLFFGLAVVMLVATYFLLRREKLHQGFND
ncbi:MAG: hypothetical protein II987_06685 [Clostridia bacterium]|nr:hypothetical protein [Clostridia bacterium]